jgi:hypothetical protein
MTPLLLVAIAINKHRCQMLSIPRREPPFYIASNSRMIAQNAPADFFCIVQSTREAA